jgi:hypothetical protein
MSDDSTTPTDLPTATRQPSPNETMYAIKTVGEDLARIRKQVRTMWIAVAVVGVLTVATAGFSLVPRTLAGAGPPGTTPAATATGGMPGGTSNGAAAGGAQAPSPTGRRP